MKPSLNKQMKINKYNNSICTRCVVGEAPDLVLIKRSAVECVRLCAVLDSRYKYFILYIDIYIYIHMCIYIPNDKQTRSQQPQQGFEKVERDHTDGRNTHMWIFRNQMTFVHNHYNPPPTYTFITTMTWSICYLITFLLPRTLAESDVSRARPRLYGALHKWSLERMFIGAWKNHKHNATSVVNMGREAKGLNDRRIRLCLVSWIVGK